MKGETFFDYDLENDSLFIYKKSKIKGSVDIGDIIRTVERYTLMKNSLMN